MFAQGNLSALTQEHRGVNQNLPLALRASTLSLMALASEQQLFLCRGNVSAATPGWIAGVFARPIRIAGVGVGAICHDIYLSCVELKLCVLLDVHYVLTALPADGTATWKTFPLPIMHLKRAIPI